MPSLTSIDARLLVGLRGPDLTASTARLALVEKMGFGDRLSGLKRWDFFHLLLESGGQPEAVVDGLKKTLARQSTFYNRNKHMYSLECRWDSETRLDGPSHADLAKRFGQSLGNAGGSGTDFDGKPGSKADILNASPVFLVEVFVQDDDSAGRDGIAAKLTRELSAPDGLGTVTVRCPGRATVWWLAIVASDDQAAVETARQIAVTKRRDQGLLLNPNYQSAEFVSAGRIERVRS
ncbi:MAG: hypothetical protein L0Z51_06075 [Candidatus Latescibacteria bacterium]|nr:hypothetical protein [Candidatus Latescibacterota bacterium]